VGRGRTRRITVPTTHTTRHPPTGTPALRHRAQATRAPLGSRCPRCDPAAARRVQFYSCTMGASCSWRRWDWRLRAGRDTHHSSSGSVLRWTNLVLGAAGIGGYAHASTRDTHIPWGTRTSAAQRNESGAEYARVEEKLRTLQKILEAKAYTYTILATVLGLAVGI